MAEEELKLTLKKNHLIAVGIVILVVAVAFFSYNYGKNSCTGGAAENTTTEIKSANAEELFVNYAGELGMDKKKFESCLKDGKYASEVQSDAQLGAQIGIQGTPAFVIGDNATSGAQPFSVFEEIIEAELKSAGKNETFAEKLVSGKEPFIGKANASLTIVEFSDFQCPFCGAFAGAKNAAYDYLKQREPTWDAAYPEIIKNYVDTGKVKYVFKAFPLSNIHANAQKAAEASLCANEQGKFIEYHDKLFEKQAEWSE